MSHRHDYDEDLEDVAHGAATASAVLSVAAMGSHPGGNVARLVPYAGALVVTWAIAVATMSGARRGLVLLAAVGAVGLFAVATYLLFFEPITYAECGALFEELNDPYCREHASVALAVWSATGAVGLLVFAAMVGRRGSDRRTARFHP